MNRIKGKKILFLANNDLGLYKFRKELIHRLRDMECDIYLSLPLGTKIEYFINMGCKYIDAPIKRRRKNPIADFVLVLRYFFLIKKISPDVVLTYTIKPNIYGSLAAKYLHIPYIVNVTGLGTALERKSLIQPLLLYLYSRVFRKVSCVFFQNNENREFFFHKRIQINNQRLIPGSGVNLKEYIYLDYPAMGDRIEFLYISRIMKEKGIEEYLNAAIQIKQKYPETTFHILGFCEEKYADRINSLVKKGIVCYHGLQQDIIPFLKKSHCTIHPTYYPEGMSNVLLESAASGRPVITTKRSGCREVVDDGITGYLVNERDTLDLIDKIKAFLSLNYSEKRAMGVRARNKVEKEFDRDIVIDAYIEEIIKNV